MPASRAVFTGAIEDFGPLEGEQKKAIRKGLKVMCRESQMGVAAAQRAFSDAGISPGKFEPERTGVVFGSDYMMSIPEDISPGIKACVDTASNFDFTQWAGVGMSKLNPLWLLKYLPNMPPASPHRHTYNDLRGPNNSLTLREAAANLAIGEAYRVILRNHADVILAGATGTRVHPMKAVHAALCEELAVAGQQPDKAARPFDLNRTGMVLGEGAGRRDFGRIGVGKISRRDHLRRSDRQRIILGGGSQVGGPARHGASQRHSSLSARCGNIAPGRRPHPCSWAQHANLRRRRSAGDSPTFGSAADRIPVTAAKSYFGNLGAGSGVIELIASLLAFKHDQLSRSSILRRPTPTVPSPWLVPAPSPAMYS